MERENETIIVYEIYFSAGPFLSLIDNRALVKDKVREWTGIDPGEWLASSGHFQSNLNPY